MWFSIRLKKVVELTDHDDGTDDKADPDDKDPDVPVLTVDTDGDGVLDKEEEGGCADSIDWTKMEQTTSLILMIKIQMFQY